MPGMSFWLRWAARDLRSRWVQVAVIALIVAVGTGVYSGLASTTSSRRESYDASYRQMRMYDLRVSLVEGGYVERGDLLTVVDRIAHPGWIARAEERLLASTLVRVPGAPQGIVTVPGRLVGVPTGGGRPRVNRIFMTAGRGLRAGDRAAVLEAKFADRYTLPVRGRLDLAGGGTLPYVGRGLSPEYFMVTTEAGAVMAEANFAAVFLPLAAAGEVAGLPGMVNDLVLTLAPGAPVETVRVEIRRALDTGIPGIAATVTGPQDDPARRLLYGDLENDRRFWDTIAYLVLAGAAFAAFNLTARSIEAQRREIGIAMALGVPRRRIALRPLIAALEIALLGAILGVGVGLLAAAGMRAVFQGLIPLPVWRAPFQPATFFRGAVIGIVLPFAAAVWPVWRAVSVSPIEAIRTGHLASRGAGSSSLLKRLPGTTFAQMPVRNLLRAPRRTLLTMFGVGAAVTVIVVTLGMLDSFEATIDRGEAEVLKDAPDRTSIELRGLVPVDSPEVSAILDSPAVGNAQPTLRVPGALSSGSTRLDVQIQLLEFQSSVWSPTIMRRAPPSGLPGIVIAEKAASDLGVEPGDRILVTHPVRTATGSLTTRQTSMQILGLHPNPLRFTAFMDAEQASLMGLVGLTNVVEVRPASGVEPDELKRALFDLEGVASIQVVSDTVTVFRDLLEVFLALLAFISAFVVALALLIAFNTASINLEERRREHATMFAFGLPLRTALRMSAAEGLLVGLLATVMGLALGVVVLRTLVANVAAYTVPEIGLLTRLSPSTVAIVFAAGILAVGVAPLLTTRRLRRMDIPSTLRVTE